MKSDSNSLFLELNTNLLFVVSRPQRRGHWTQPSGHPLSPRQHEHDHDHLGWWSHVLIAPTTL